MKKTAKKTAPKGPVWNLKLLYQSPEDPKIEADMKEIERLVSAFAESYDVADKAFLKDDGVLLRSLNDYLKIAAMGDPKPILYFFYLKTIEADNPVVAPNLSLIEGRLASISNKLAFFQVGLGTISPARQRDIAARAEFKGFKVFLQRIFDDAKHVLTVPEEKIMSLKSLPAHSMWTSATDKILDMVTVVWKKKTIPLPTAFQLIAKLPSSKERQQLAKIVAEALKKVAPTAEAEMNAIITNKKIDDELRGFSTPYESTMIGYRNDPKVIDALRKAVKDNVSISHSFYKVKARLLKQKSLNYSDRAATIGKTSSKYTFDETMEILKDTFGSLNPEYRTILDGYVKNGQIDAPPRVGKAGGAYCSGSYAKPTFVELNHTDDFNSFMTCAHELGHAIHTESSQIQSPLYFNFSTALAETASTLFEAIAFDAVYDTLSDKEKIIALHDLINDDISTVFRQIACFNFELDLHTNTRAKGYLTKEEIADMHNKNMSVYLGPLFKLERNDGYMFVQWSHIRMFFYVYSYAYGQLVSKALLRRYKQDTSFWKSIEKFLSAGGKDSPENILKEIGIDVYSPGFWEEGLQEIADDIAKLERLTAKPGKK